MLLYVLKESLIIIKGWGIYVQLVSQNGTGALSGQLRILSMIQVYLMNLLEHKIAFPIVESLLPISCNILEERFSLHVDVTMTVKSEI